jgi:hypothetical protein
MVYAELSTMRESDGVYVEVLNGPRKVWLTKRRRQEIRDVIVWFRLAAWDS